MPDRILKVVNKIKDFLEDHSFLSFVLHVGFGIGFAIIVYKFFSGNIIIPSVWYRIYLFLSILWVFFMWRLYEVFYKLVHKKNDPHRAMAGNILLGGLILVLGSSFLLSSTLKGLGISTLIVIIIFLIYYLVNRDKPVPRQKPTVVRQAPSPPKQADYESYYAKVREKINEINTYCDNLIETITKDDKYLIYSFRSTESTKLEKFLNEIADIRETGHLTKELKQQLMDSMKKVSSTQGKIISFNSEFVEDKKKEYASLFHKEHISMDERQKEAIIIDDTHNLVVAGAGAGKTEVLITRIAYLIKRKSDSIKSDRILALAFQNKASHEIKDRLKEHYGLDVDIKTFHSLGRQILKESGNSIKLYGGDNSDFKSRRLIATLLSEAEKDPEIQKMIIDYMVNIGSAETLKTEAEFNHKKEFYDYMAGLRYTALNGTKVKSIGKRDVLNFFLTHTLNGEFVQIGYEEYADWMKDKPTDRPPQPDFFLKNLDIYIEHWSIDKDGKVPPWYEKDYIKTMNIKKNKFKSQKKYLLVETTFGEFVNNPDFYKILEERLLKALHKKNPDKKFEFKPVPYESLIDKVWDECKASHRNLPLNIWNYIVIAKTYKLSPKDIDKRLKSNGWSYLQESFGKIAVNIYAMYHKFMEKEDYIDYQDMINLAITALKDDPEMYKNKYDHILIDEYQDISTQRYWLVKEMLHKNDGCKLFCVGDDWQSIMGFSGANVKYFINFKEYFSSPAITKLDVNYRSIKSVVDAGSRIIQRNIDKKIQLSKKIKASNSKELPIIILSSNHKDGYVNFYHNDVSIECAKRIKEYHDKGYHWKDMMILTRIMKNKRFNEIFYETLKKERIPITHEIMEDETIEELPNGDDDRVRYMTVHKSKGLQAKIVFILNMDKGLYGFPCELESPSLFETARTERLEDREAEELRLFYVAITRAKEEVIMFSRKDVHSKFLDYLIGSKDVKVEELPRYLYNNVKYQTTLDNHTNTH